MNVKTMEIAQAELLPPETKSDKKPARARRAKEQTALAPVQAPTTPSAQSSESAAIFSIIERAARDPNVDIDKMERLVRMKLDMEAHAAKASYLAALAEMQPKLPVINKRGTISKNVKDDRGNNTGRQEAMTKYAKWEDVVEATTPVLSAHGFSLSFRVAQPTPDRVAVSGVLGHRDGHTEETALSLPIDNSGAKNNVQGWGSSVSYGKRYTAFALLNISARGEDDDGNGGHKGGAAGSAGAGTDFRPDGPRRFTGRSWTDDDPHLVDNTREKGTMPAKKQPAPKPATPAPAKSTAATPVTRAEKIKAGADRRIKILQDGIDGHPWTRQTLDQFWADETEWHSVIREEAPKQFERFEQAFLEAKEKL